MGEVWFGYDKRLDRPVAIKFIRVDRLSGGAPDSELTKRFVRESRTTARLEHPGVPAVYDCGTEGDNLYLVMQLVKGSPVSYLLDEVEQVPIGWAAAIATQVCSVLAVAHAESLVHRDLKPANLMLCQNGTVKVLDFGVAAALSPTATRLTATGIVVGTAEYMAPEQAMSGTVSPQTDLYSLGVILRELLTGTNQFAGETPLASMRRHVDDAPQPLRALRADVPEELERLVLWLLAKNPSQRPPNAVVAYERLLPFCCGLPPLPDFVAVDASHPVLMYAAVIGRIGTSGEKTPSEETTQTPAKAPVPESSSVPPYQPQDKIARARKESSVLKAESRFRQAAEVLSNAVEAAVHSLGPEHDEALQLRIELTDVLFLGGDYRRAASEFQRLIADLTQRKGPDDDHVLRFRLMEANCRAALGDIGLALTQLRRLLQDEERFGVDEERILDLRRRIGLLELGSGDRTRAGESLRDLLPDLERRYGSRHPNVGKVREILEELAEQKDGLGLQAIRQPPETRGQFGLH
ncbi:serine/threonine-protein kinase [Nonomuraea sp. C10]|uniref:serine/threonine-protein kinase n=1 Tax=Nonomuraea sp. C10 TaxID=2600577 RepID=UPI001C9D4889|nr:protein kinase [Nonomuraea sp. C10]